MPPSLTTEQFMAQLLQAVRGLGSAQDVVRAYAPQYLGRGMYYYGYQASWASLAANASGQASDAPVTIDAGSVFLCTSLGAFEWSAAGGTAEQTPPDFTLQITNTGTSLSLWSAAVMGAMLFGWGTGSDHIYTLPRPEIFPGGSTLSFVAGNRSATARELYIVAIGVRIQSYAA